MQTLGLIFSLLTALTWSGAVILFKVGGTHISPVALNLFKSGVGLVLLVFTILVLPHQAAQHARWTEAGWLMLSGVVGIAIADSLFLFSLNTLGASRSAIVDCTYSPSIVLISALWLGESISIVDALGALLIISAVLLATTPKVRDNDPQQILRGVIAGIFAMVLMAFAIVGVKPMLETWSVLHATTLRLLGGFCGLFVWILKDPQLRRECLRSLQPNSSWRVIIPGAILGTYFALLFWIGGFKYAPASISAILNQTSTVFTVLFAALFLREVLNRRQIFALLLALLGSGMVIYQNL